MASVVVAVYATRPEAEIGRARLEAAGIRAAVLGDDAGGLYPNLSPGGVRLVVAASQEPEAREVLAAPAEEALPGT